MTNVAKYNMQFKEWFKLQEAGLTFSAGFRGASRSNLGDPIKSSQYSSMFPPSNKQLQAGHEGEIWQIIDKRIDKDDCQGAQSAFNALKKDYEGQGKLDKARNAQIGFNNRYDVSSCPINYLIDKGDCEGAFEKSVQIQDILKMKNKLSDADKIDKKFWGRFNTSSCKTAI